MKKYILSVDDDPEINELMKHRFKTLNYEIKTTSTPQEFLDAYHQRKPDLCLIDLDIGVAGAGMLLIRGIRIMDEETPIIILSRHDETDTTSHALELGADDFITKPPTKERFLQILARYLPLGDQARPNDPMKKVPSAANRAEVSFPVELFAVDERGVWVTSKHLISKGSVFYFLSEEFQRIANRETPILLSVSQNPIHPDLPEEAYKIYGTFDPSDDELIMRIRSWLISKQNS